MVEFNMKSRPKHRKGKEKSKYFWYCKFLYVGRELLINVFKSGIFPVKEQQGKELKILTPT